VVVPSVLLGRWFTLLRIDQDPPLLHTMCPDHVASVELKAVTRSTRLRYPRGGVCLLGEEEHWGRLLRPWLSMVLMDPQVPATAVTDLSAAKGCIVPIG